MPKQIISTCCGRVLNLSEEHAALVYEGTTYDCPNPNCDKLMVFTDSEGNNKGFHEWMHERNKNWPKDGSNTGFVEI